uniref:cucumber peeling cupredoxin-like n=1 Tax=Erigeron canadensis TaxID=72917 RepID=UPI001CB8AD86|nr:cucumber peeling cupredoxin-like [Erigeron canadensis]
MATPAVYFTLLAFLITTTAAYTNYTVGGPAGWFFDPTANTSSANYQSWSANKTFNLGDYLIFNTNTNQTVILTYNETTFKSCSIDNSSDSDTFYFGQDNTVFKPYTVAVPLTIVGPNYFFSDAFDGIQCEQGMAFGVNVSQGVGLPPNLNQPPPPPYVEAPSNGVGSLRPPVTDSQPSDGGLSVGDNVRVVVCFGLALFGSLVYFDF